MTARPCSSATAAWWAIDLEQRALLVGERDVLVRDELADLAALPAERRADGVLAGAALRPRDAPVLEHERRAGRLHRVHRRLDDRLERLLEIERLRDRLGDLRERLELGDAALRVGVELRVDDRLRHLARDRLEQLDLVLPELARLAGADVERAGELVARDDRHREDRLELRLRQVRELLPARVEMRLGRDRDGPSLGGGRAGDPLADAEPRPARHLVERRAARRAEDELAGRLVVEVDEARVGLERGGDLVRDEVEHLLEVERRVDGGARLGQQPQMAFAGVHAAYRRSRRARNGVSSSGRSVV